MVETSVLLDRVAKATGQVKEKVLAEGVSEYLKAKLREVNAEALEIRCKYDVSSAGDMDGKYQRGELDEEGTWRDFFRLTHLEEKRATLEKLLEEASIAKA